MNESDALLLRIAQCDLVPQARLNAAHPCHQIVTLRGNLAFQVPEPWSGQIDRAPILFVSSNPSITEEERYPDSSWTPEEITDFFQNRFAVPDGPAAGLKALLNDGKTRKKVVNYWAHARARSSEILGIRRSEVKPGIHFALTEVVHCKSRNEIGVGRAKERCIDRYFGDTLSLSAAPIFVVYGIHAETTVRERLRIETLLPRLAKCTINNRSRLIVFLPAPSSFDEPKTVLANVGEVGFEQIRSHLRAAETK